MACGMIAFKELGINIESYDAFEIDKYAIKVSTHNFPEIKQHGDVFKGDFTQFEGVDWVIGGSPCTHWSIAQKNNRETTASGIGWELFQQYVRAIKEAKPKYFLYENNKSMSKEIRASIDKEFGFEAVCINSALVSAQNRQRLYWVGKREPDGTYSKVDVEQPKDKGILLRDVLDNAVAWQEKSYALTTRCQGAIPEDTLAKRRHTMAAEPVNITPDGKSQTLRATCYKDGIRNMVGNNVDRKTCVAEPVGAKTGLYVISVGNMYEKQGQNGQLFSIEGKSKTLSAGTGVSGRGIGSNNAPKVCTPCDGVYAIPVEFDGDKPVKAMSGADGKKYDVYEVEDGYITIKSKRYAIKLVDGYYIIRKLTVRECMRLQTIPDWYDFSVISNSQAYKCLGNGWTCDVITHLIKSALNQKTSQA
jgi:DNA (cytosine-5)-methyltransferase 3A